MKWRIRKEDDGDYLEIWQTSDPATDAPDQTIAGTPGQFKYKVKKNQILQSPAELDEVGEMLATVDNRTLENVT